MKTFKKELAQELVKEIVKGYTSNSREELVQICKTAIYENFKVGKKCLDYVNYNLRKDVVANITIEQFMDGIFLN
jgi:hypothetical protein